MIIFTSDSENPDGGDWVHIHMGSGSMVEYCIAEYARGALDIAENTGDSVIISNNILRHNLWTALTIHKGSRSTVTGNKIYDSGGHQGIAVEDNALVENNEIKNCKAGIVNSGINPTIRNNMLIDNDCGIYIVGNSNAIIEGNTISSPNGGQNDWTYMGKSVYFASTKEKNYGSVTGITIIYSSPDIFGNKIENCACNISVVGESSPTICHNIISNGRDNGIHFEQSFEGTPQIYSNNFDNSNNIGMSSSCSIDATNNWWNTTDPEDIENRISHYNDDPSRGMVSFEPYLTKPYDF
jgi:parallel beta-helix repeat protein